MNPYIILSRREERILEHSRLRENLVEFRIPYKCTTCSFYDEYAGCLYESNSKEWRCFKNIQGDDL